MPSATEELPTPRAALAMGRYRLGARLGSGGFGTVYAARDERLGRPVAVKVIPAGGPAPERAQREARAVARLDHDAIVALFDAGEENGARYLVSELVEGRTLAELERDGALSDRDVIRVGLALADALAHAHERGVIHRDVKPQNVIVPDHAGSRRGAAKLTDFGVAHLGGEEALTLTGDVVGTLAYMAPEQAAGRPADERADLYALALVLYEALAGRNPVAAGSPTATARRIGTVLPALGRARADLPAELTAAIDRALLPDPEARGGLDDLFDALADALPEVDDEGGSIAPHPLERRLPLLPPAIGRLVAPAAAGALVWAALAGLTPEPAARAAARGRRDGGRGRAAAAARAGWPRRPRPRSRSPSARRRARAPRSSCWRSRSARRCCCAPTGGPGRCPPRPPCSASPASPAPTPRWPGARRAGAPGWRSGCSAPGGWCWPSRCWTGRSSSARCPARPTATGSTARWGSRPATSSRPPSPRARSPSACCGASPRSSCRGSCAAARSRSTRSPPPSGRPARRRPRRRWRRRSACPSRAASWPVRSRPGVLALALAHLRAAARATGGVNAHAGRGATILS